MAAPTPPTPAPPVNPTGDVCRDEVSCLASQIGTLKGCLCRDGKCSGTDPESGMVLGCNRATDRCAPCIAGQLFCVCLPGNSCSAGLTCDNEICMPEPTFSLPCSQPGGIGCPCLADRCQPKYACSSQLSRCITCPVGCSEKCAQAALNTTDPCAGKSTSCNLCKATKNCVWCGATGGCRTDNCIDGSTGQAVCSSCAGVSECNGGGKCVGPDTCQCNHDFVPDSILGCKPASGENECSSLQTQLARVCGDNSEDAQTVMLAATIGAQTAKVQAACKAVASFRQCKVKLYAHCKAELSDEFCDSPAMAQRVDAVCGNLCASATTTTSKTDSGIVVDRSSDAQSVAQSWRAVVLQLLVAAVSIFSTQH